MQRPKLIAHVCACLVLITTGSSTRADDFQALAKQGTANFATKEGRAYQLGPFEQAIAKVYAPALHVCLEQPDTVEPGEIIFVIAANGTVERVLSDPKVPYAVCVARHLKEVHHV